VHLSLDRDGVGALCEAPDDWVAPPATPRVWVPVKLILVLHSHKYGRTQQLMHALFVHMYQHRAHLGNQTFGLGGPSPSNPLTKWRLAHQTTMMNMDSVAYSLPSELLRWYALFMPACNSQFSACVSHHIYTRRRSLTE